MENRPVSVFTTKIASVPKILERCLRRPCFLFTRPGLFLERGAAL